MIAHKHTKKKLCLSLAFRIARHKCLHLSFHCCYIRRNAAEKNVKKKKKLVMNERENKPKEQQKERQSVLLQKE